MVETVLMLAFVLVLMLAIIEFGFILWAYVQVTNATRVGARAGTLYNATSPFPSCLDTVSQAVGGNGQTGGELPATWTISIDASDNCDNGTLTAGEELTVAVTYDFSLPFVSSLRPLSDLVGPTFIIQRTSVMRVQ